VSPNPASPLCCSKPMLRRTSAPGEVEADDDEAHRRTRAGQLQHKPEQGDDGELVPEIRDAQPQPKPLKRDGAMERQQQSSHHFLLLCTMARVPADAFLFNLI
jgi:hypothetical protein